MMPSGTYSDPLIGQLIADRYRILRLLDRGGMGKVYEATQESLGRKVAIKTMEVHDPDGAFEKRFFLEASACARLSSPHIVRIYDHGQMPDGRFYIAMEFLEGASLSALIKSQAPLPPLRAIHIVRQICSALREAHSQGIVHRDMKPANVFLTPHGDSGDFVKVLDFGLVKDLAVDEGLSISGQVLGTPAYMAPEQVQHNTLDQRTDLYAVGVILYKALTGQSPFKGPNTVAIMVQQLKKPAPSFHDIAPELDLPKSLEWVVQTAIQKDPSERFLHMSEMSRALRIVARELRGELNDPPQLGLRGGRLVLPEHLVDPLDEIDQWELPIGVPSDASARSATTLIPQSTAVKTLAVGATMSFMAGAAMLFVGLLLVAAAGGFLYLQSLPTDADPVATATNGPNSAVLNHTNSIVIKSLPLGASVFRGDTFIGTTGFENGAHLRLALEPGEVAKLRFERPGNEPVHQDVTLATGTITARMNPTPEPSAAPAPSGAPAKPNQAKAAPASSGLKDPFADLPE